MKPSERITCVAGCQAFMGGEIRHHKHCAFYEGSFSQMYDSQAERIKVLKEILRNLNKTRKILGEAHGGQMFRKELWVPVQDALTADDEREKRG